MSHWISLEQELRLMAAARTAADAPAHRVPFSTHELLAPEIREVVACMEAVVCAADAGALSASS